MTDSLAKMKEDVLFRGTRNGVLMVLNDQTDYALLKQRLAERLSAAENFFYPGAGVTLDVGSRVLTTAQLLDLEELLQHPHGLRLINVIHSSPARDGDNSAAAVAESGPASGPTISTRATAPSAAPQPDPEPGAAAGETLLIKRTLRSGQRVRYNGNVVILGEVNPGAEVVAAGDIIVMGALRGVAHAGAGGRDDAIVVAFRLQPTQLRIGSYIARAPEGADAPDAPELARVQDGKITIEADPHRFF